MQQAINPHQLTESSKFQAFCSGWVPQWTHCEIYFRFLIGAYRDPEEGVWKAQAFVEGDIYLAAQADTSDKALSELKEELFRRHQEHMQYYVREFMLEEAHHASQN